MRKILSVIFIISVLLFTCTLFSCGEKTGDNSDATSDTTETTESTTEAATEPVTTTEAGPKKVNKWIAFSDSSVPEDRNPVSVGANGITSIGAKFTADFIITDITIECPSWSDDVGSMVFKIYTWNTDYATTVAGTAVFTDTTSFVDYSDNDFVSVTFNPEIEPGTYLWELSDGKGGVGVWAFKTHGEEGLEFYKNGELFTDNTAFNAEINGYIME